MDKALSIEEHISVRYGALSEKLQDAADYVVANPIEVATRSLRSVATASSLAPSTFSRLARALGFDSYEELRELSRDAVGRRVVTFSDKARRLRTQSGGGGAPQPDVLHRHAAACVQNIEDMASAIPSEKLNAVVERLAGARHVTLLGSLASRGAVDYMHYLAGWLSDRWSLAHESGSTLAVSIADAQADDAFILVTKPPFARTSMRAAQLAAKKGAYLLVITDTHTCPALEFASASFILPTDSPHFFSSFVSTMLLVETLLSMLAARLGPDAEDRIREIQEKNQTLGLYWASE